MPITYIFIGITALVSYQAFTKRELIHRFILNPYQIIHRKEWWRLFTSGIIHADLNHLLLNMLVLFFFGTNVENRYVYEFGPLQGKIFFVSLYVLALAASSIKDVIKEKDNYAYNALGASGATSAVLFANIFFYPFQDLYLYFLIPLPQILFGVVYLWYSSYMAKKKVDNIGHSAHFYGAIFGVGFTIMLKPELLMQFIIMIERDWMQLFS